MCAVCVLVIYVRVCHKEKFSRTAHNGEGMRRRGRKKTDARKEGENIGGTREIERYT